MWSVEEFFQQEKNNSPFKNHEEFHKVVAAVVANVDGNRVESYSEWPFLKFSLPLMVRSMVGDGGWSPSGDVIHTETG